VVNRLCDQVGGKNIAIMGLYRHFPSQHEKFTTTILSAILKQLVTREGIPEHTQEAFQKVKTEFGCGGLPIRDRVDFLKKAIALLGRGYICPDAPDKAAPQHQ